MPEGTESNELKQLTRRYLTACEGVYPVALANADIRLAGLIARSALSIVVNAADQLGQSVAQPLALNWFERLTLLYKDTSPPADVGRTLKWASTAMIGVLRQSDQASPKDLPD
jgi:hypothetical protein